MDFTFLCGLKSPDENEVISNEVQLIRDLVDFNENRDHGTRRPEAFGK
jgi:hypothetical protein